MMETAQLPDHCATCGIVAPREQLVAEKDDTYCPTCATGEEGRSSGGVEEVAFIAFALVCFIYYRLGVDDFRVEAGRVVLVGIAVYLLLTCLHEAGHAVMAVLTRRELVGVVLGHGQRRLVRFRVRGVVFEVRANLLGGSTYAIGRPGQSGAWLYVLGGVGAEALVLVGAWFWNPDHELLEVVRLAVMVFTAYDIVANLWPRLVTHPPLGQVPNDGLLLWRLLRGASEDDEMGIEYNAADVRSAMWAETDGQELSLARAAADFAKGPDRELNRYRFGHCLLIAERWAESLVVMRPLEHWSGLTGSSRAMVLNNLAWSALMAFDKSLLVEADRWSAEAAEMRPVEPAISSTRGSALVMLGKPDLGLPLLERAYGVLTSQPREKALVSGFGAIGAQDRGDRPAMRLLYAAMVAHDPACAIRRQVERCIAKPEVAAFAAFVEDERGSIDISELRDEELAVLSAMATLALARINGVVLGERLSDDAQVEVEGRSASVSSIRAAARLVLAEQALAPALAFDSSIFCESNSH